MKFHRIWSRLFGSIQKRWIFFWKPIDFFEDIWYNIYVPKKRPVGQEVKTSPSHGDIGSSILPRVTIKKERAVALSFFIAVLYRSEPSKWREVIYFVTHKEKSWRISLIHANCHLRWNKGVAFVPFDLSHTSMPKDSYGVGSGCSFFFIAILRRSERKLDKNNYIPSERHKKRAIRESPLHMLGHRIWNHLRYKKE